jgi:iron complex outermembrane receptor protein
MNRRFLLSTVAGVILASTAHAQSAGVAPSAQTKAQSQASSAPIEEIVVTAQKREEKLQRVPIAITTLTGNALTEQGVNQPVDLVALVPGLAISSGNGPVTQIYIRGVGTSTANLFGDNAVAFNVDGIVLARDTGLENQFYDVARVEVLKGPQGTLYGRNATGGAINVITNKPVLGDYQGNIAAEVGNYGLLDENLMVNVPVTDKFAFRIAGRLMSRDGYFSDGYDDDKSGAVRFRALYQANDDLSILLNADYSAQNEKGASGVLSPFLNSSNPWLGGSTSQEQAVFKTLAKPLPLAPQGSDGFDKTRNIGVSAEINWDTSFGTVTILPAYRILHDAFRDYVPGFLNDYVETDAQESLEARLASDDTEAFSYVVGAFLLHDNRTANQYVNQTITASQTNITSLPDDSEAVFGQAKYKLTDVLRLTAGVRYTRETKSETASSLNPTTLVLTPYLGNESFNNVSWKAGVEYDLTPSSLLYANVGTGFKAGGFFSSPAPYNTYQPEKITAYTIGSKNTFLDGHLRLNGEAFYWDYKNHQESHLGISPTGAIVYQTQNVGHATMKGAELETDYAVWDMGELTTRIQYLDAQFDTFGYTEAAPALPPSSGCALTLLSKGVYNVNCNGKPAIRSPRWSGNVGFRQGFDLGNLGHLNANVDVEFSGSSFQGIDYVAAEHQGDYALVDLNFDYTPPGGHWKVSAWVRNIGNTAVINGVNQQLFAPSIVLVDLRPPRTFGGRLSYDF